MNIMNKLRHKWHLITLTLLLSSLSVNTYAHNSSESVVALTIKNIAAHIDQRVSNMKILANSIANDTHIHNWVNTGFNPSDENTLVDKLGYLVNEYALTSASFADTNSNKYWNHEGFLRVLTPEIDTWYFAYLNSKEQDLISVYHDKNKHRVDLYVNYRQKNGHGLSGIATSFDGVVDMLKQSPLNQQGELFIVDSNGKVQIHTNQNVAGKLDLQQLYSPAAAEKLLNNKQINHFTSPELKNHYLVAQYIPSMNWYLIAHMNNADQQ